MPWMIVLCAIAIGEHALHPFLTNAWTWEIALSAKYLSFAVVMQALLLESGHRPLFHRSLIALFCIGAWVDFAEQCLYQIYGFDYSLPIMVIFSTWLVYAAKRKYDVVGDHITGDNVFVLFLRPRSGLDLIKSFLGFPVSSVCIYAKGSVWSFRAKTGRFDVYRVSERFISKHIAINTGTPFSDELQYALDSQVGKSRFPGIKCVWAIRHVLRKLGGDFVPRWCDYIPGIYAMKLLRGRG